LRGSDILATKKKVKDERECSDCEYDHSDNCDDCYKKDMWTPKNGGKTTMSVNGGPEVPFPSKEADAEAAKVVEKHLPKRIKSSPFGDNGHVLHEYDDGRVQLDDGALTTRELMKDAIELAKKIKPVPKQLDLEGKEVQYPIDVESEEFTVLEFTCGGWSLKVRDDKLDEAKISDNVKALVQRRLKADSGTYPIAPGEFDRWVERFTDALEDY
jgi:hypothetical protein